MKFQHINDFSTGDPDKLNRELSRFEDNVSAALDALVDEKQPAFSVLDFTATAARPIVALRPDTQTNIDTSMRNAAAVLPPPTPSNFGRRFVLIKNVSANSIIVSCQDATVTYNGSTTFPTLTSCGSATFFCNKQGYYA